MPTTGSPAPTVVGDITPFIGKWTNDQGEFVIVAPDGAVTATFREYVDCTAGNHTDCDTVANGKLVSPGGHLTAKVTTFEANVGATLMTAHGTIQSSNSSSAVKAGTTFWMTYGWGASTASRVLSTSSSGVFARCSTNTTGCGTLDYSDGHQTKTTPAGGAQSDSGGSGGSPGSGATAIGWSPFIGTWETGDGGSAISVDKTGTVTVTYRTYTWCGGSGASTPCDSHNGNSITPGGHVTAKVTSVEGTTATATIKTSNDYRHPVGSVFALALTSHPGQMDGPAGFYQRVSPSPSH